MCVNVDRSTLGTLIEARDFTGVSLIGYASNIYKQQSMPKYGHVNIIYYTVQKCIVVSILPANSYYGRVGRAILHSCPTVLSGFFSLLVAFEQ